MPTDYIKLIYDSEGFKKAADEQLALGAAYEKTVKAQERVNTSATKLSTKLSRLGSFGRDLRQAGGFLGSDTLMALGNFADGLSDVGQSIDAINSKGSKLAKVAGVLGSIVGGVGVGASVYDATIGKLQGQTAGNIVDQFGKFAAAGFNQDQLRRNMASELSSISFSIKEAQIKAEMVEMQYSKSLQGKSQDELIRDLIAYGASALVGAGGAGRAFQAGNELVQRPKRQQTIDYFQGVQGMVGAGANLLQAGQTFQNRTAGARNMYASALYAIDQEVGQKRAEIVRNYSQSLLQLDQAYYAQRQQVAEQYGIETARLEADHQKNIRRMQEDHQGRLKKLVESRDALAVEDEIEQFNKDRQRAEEDYQELMQERQADYAMQLREMERAHQEQRNERQRAYQEQLRDLNLQAQQRRQQEAAQYALLLRDIVQAFTDARNEFAASVTNNNTSNVTNNNQSPTVNITGQSSIDAIENAVYGAIMGAFG